MAPKQNLNLAQTGMMVGGNTHPASSTSSTTRIITVIHCWTAPRSRSTALLYSFEARGTDCCVAIDEPLKREWLIHHGDSVQRPYKTNMINGTPPADKPEESALWQRETLSLGERIHLAAMKLSKTDEKDCVIFCKHMSKTCFLYDFDNDVHVEPIAGVTLVHKHMFLVRDPVAILRSWDVLSSVHYDSCSTNDVGIVPLLTIHAAIQQRPFGPGQAHRNHVTILDSDALVKNPEQVLQDICQDLDIPYKSEMMTWKAGPHECDSRHAPWWYVNAQKSTGWLQNAPKTKKSEITPEEEKEQTAAFVIPPPKPINPKLMPALKESFPAYEILKLLALGSSNSGNTSEE